MESIKIILKKTTDFLCIPVDFNGISIVLLSHTIFNGIRKTSVMEPDCF